MLSSPSSSSFLAAPPLSPKPPSSSPPPSPPSVRFGTVRSFAAGGATATTAEQQEKKAKNKNATASYLNIENPRGLTAASLYEILGIPTRATCEEVKAAYRRLARVCHPDVASSDRKDSSAEEFRKIHDAYSTLSDPAKRADYDRRLLIRRRGRPLTVVASGFSGYTRRNWETDQCW